MDKVGARGGSTQTGRDWIQVTTSQTRYLVRGQASSRVSRNTEPAPAAITHNDAMPLSNVMAVLGGQGRTPRRHHKLTFPASHKTVTESPHAADSTPRARPPLGPAKPTPPARRAQWRMPREHFKSRLSRVECRGRKGMKHNARPGTVETPASFAPVRGYGASPACRLHSRGISVSPPPLSEVPGGARAQRGTDLDITPTRRRRSEANGQWLKGPRMPHRFRFGDVQRLWYWN